MTTTPFRLTALVLACCAAACGDSSSSRADVASDAANDATGDPSTDVGGLDGAIDANTDAPTDAPSDSTTTDIGDATEDARDSDTGPSPAGPWREPVEFAPEPTLAAAHPAVFERISSWATHIDASPRPLVGQLGGFAVGNGHVFALLGYGDPLNSLHSMVGPTYDKREAFFGDYTLHLVDEGEQLPFDEEWVAQSLSAPVVMTRGRSGHLTLDTVDFAPWTEGDERFCIVRRVVVTNNGPDQERSLAVRVTSYGRAEFSSGMLHEYRDDRSLVTTSPITRAGPGAAMDVEVPRLDPGEAATVDITHCAAHDREALGRPSGDVGAWLDDTAGAYAEWESRLTDYNLPDRAADDFLEGMKLTLINQTAATGATCPMSQYTRTWARDNIGPVLAWHAYGAFEEARATMDYIYGAVVAGGDLSNSYAADLDLSALPPAPDWDSLGPLGTRVAAETPSYMVWIYGEHVRHTGEYDFVEQRWGFLRRALFAQAFSDGLLLPFTDDETYRAAMNAAFGLALEYPHGARHFSANSSLLWLGAARHFERMAELVGSDADAAEVATMFADVESAAEAHFLLEDACIAAYEDRESGELSPPFEDVALKATWAGWLDSSDPRAAANIACLVDRISPEPGVVRSPLHDDYVGFPALGGGEGVFTGMLPGYTLRGLTDVAHPDAEASFRAMGRFASTSGNFQEYVDASTEAGLQLVYDRSGQQGDYTSKYRPWEGGINAHAVIDYLFGVRVDALERTVELRPHLPSGWPAMSATGVRIGDERFDVAVARADTLGHSVELANRGAEDLQVTLLWDSEGEVVVRVDDEALEGTDVTTGHFGIRTTTTPALVVPADGRVSFRILPR